MALEIPKNPKVYTTKYENFRGVDFTNDPTNVWYRRSPSGKNMLPDASGVPFKRHGWKKHIMKESLIARYCYDKSIDFNSEDAPKEVSINKLHYFTLNGIDHIFIFANIGVFIYRMKYEYDSESEESVTTEEIATSSYSYMLDVIESYNRAFFFEGDGEAAFYIYGNFKLWRYSYAERDGVQGFWFEEVEPYIPTVNIGVDAKHETGTAYESVNLFGNYIAETFQNNKYAEGVYKIQLPASFESADGIKVEVSIESQFDTQLEIITTSVSPIPSGKVYLYHDTLTFGSEYSWVTGEDAIKVTYPRKSATKRSYSTDAAEISVVAG